VEKGAGWITYFVVVAMFVFPAPSFIKPFSGPIFMMGRRRREERRMEGGGKEKETYGLHEEERPDRQTTGHPTMFPLILGGTEQI
jgi:hypothetical protein